MKGINKVGLYTISDPFEDMYEMNALADEMNAKLLDEKGIIKALKSECDLEITM